MLALHMYSRQELCVAPAFVQLHKHLMTTFHPNVCQHNRNRESGSEGNQREFASGVFPAARDYAHLYWL